MKISTTNCEQIQNGNIFCCLFEKFKNSSKFLLPLILFFGLIQGVFAQGTLQPACNIGGPLEACAKTSTANTSGDMVIDIDVARSGVGAILTYTLNPLLNSSGAFIRSVGPQVYHGPLDPVISLRNHTTQTLIIFPGTTGSGFDLLLSVENTESSPHTFCTCSKSVSVSQLTADSSYTPILCYGDLSTLTAEGHLSDQNAYTYKLLPSGPTNATGVFPNLPGSVAGITYTVEVESAEGCVEYTSQTITQPADNPVILNCPVNGSIGACSSQTQVDEAFNTWLNSFSFTGGTNTNMTRTPSSPNAPPICGGTVEVRWDVTQSCYPTATCSRTFTVGTPTPATITCGNNVTLPACSTQAEVDAAWTAFKLQGSASGGCNGSLTNNAPANPPSICGGSVDVTWTYTSSCEAPKTCTKTFAITAPTPATITCGNNVTMPACSTQAEVDAAWTAFKLQGSASGGCNGSLSNNAPANPPLICGGAVDVTWTYTSSCEAPKTCTKTFAITAPTAATIACGNNVTMPACSTQAAINAAWTAFKLQGSASGGCNGSLTNNAPANPPLICGGSVDVTWTYTSSCEAPKTCTKTFAITAPSPVTLTCPQNINLAGGLLTQTQIDTAYNDWLASVTYGGGCNPSISNNSSGAPSYCGGTSSVTFTVTSDCEAPKQCTATFTISQCASLGNYVWNDSNFNGLQDGSEVGVPGVTVTLYRCSNNSVVAVQLTGALGQYLFNNLTPGGYYVGFSGFPPNFVMTSQDAGANDAVDSDGNPLTGLTSCITLAAGESNLTIDQGINLPQASLGDFVWEDLDVDGIQDANEIGVPGVTVKLYTCGGTLVATQITGANGGYLFTGLAPGSYYVEFSNLPLLGGGFYYVFTPQNAPANSNANDATDSDVDINTGKTACVTLTAGQNNLTVDAGIYKEQCFESCTGNPAVGATIYTINANNTVTIRTTFKKTFVDNTYGTNAVGWGSSGHTFAQLVGSDHLQLQLLDKAGTVKLHLKIDYITLSTVSAQYPSGYRSLGVTGGDGSMIVGNAARVLSSTTSFEKNLNNANANYRLYTNSPATSPNTGYNVVDPQFNNWIFDVWYEVVVSLADFGTGNLAFDKPVIYSVHASPSKTGNNTECVQPCEPVTVAVTGTNGCGTGTCIGSATAVAAHGTLPYTYNWVGPNGPLAQHTASVTGLCPGTYSVTAIATVGGSATAQVVIGAPAPAPCGICYESCTGNSNVGATQTVTNNGDGTTTIRTTFAKTFVDNTYGTGAIGWGTAGHKFKDLTGSDKLQLALYDVGGVKRLEFKLDYLTDYKPVVAAKPSGYKSLGVSGGDGGMILGAAAKVKSVLTSMDVNLNNNGPSYYLTTNSPLTNASYATNLSAFPNWIYDVWYEVTVYNDAFPGGFGYPRITDVHASPSKTGNNTECVKICGTTPRTDSIKVVDGTDFEAYPIPFKDVLTIKYQFNYKTDVKIELINILGMTIFSQTDTDSYMNKELSLDLKAIIVSEQVYFVKLTTNRGSSIRKVISSK